MILEEYSMGDGSWRTGWNICMGNFNLHWYVISSTIHPTYNHKNIQTIV